LQSLISLFSFIFERLIKIDKLTSISLDALLLLVFLSLFIVAIVVALNNLNYLYLTLSFKIINVFKELLVAKFFYIISNTLNLFAKDTKVSRNSIFYFDDISCATNC